MIVKVCGLAREDDVRLCQTLGVDMVGFIFHPQSPRRVDPAWVGGVATSCRKVGVFTVQDTATIAHMAAEAQLDMLQLHGPYAPATGQVLGPERVIAVLWPERFPTPQAFLRAASSWQGHCRFLLLDAGRCGGGHGRPWRLPWSLPALPLPWILAGGLGPETIAAACALRPDGVDLNSGVEARPGVKDAAKLRQTLNHLRGCS